MPKNFCRDFLKVFLWPGHWEIRSYISHTSPENSMHVYILYILCTIQEHNYIAHVRSYELPSSFLPHMNWRCIGRCSIQDTKHSEWKLIEIQLEPVPQAVVVAAVLPLLSSLAGWRLEELLGFHVHITWELPLEGDEYTHSIHVVERTTHMWELSAHAC